MRTDRSNAYTSIATVTGPLAGATCQVSFAILAMRSGAPFAFARTATTCRANSRIR